MAPRFAAEGATVYLTGRREAELKSAVEQIGDRAAGIRSDVSRLDDLDRLFAEIAERGGRLDIVVANAGVGDFGPLGTITEDEYDRATSINLKGTVFTVQKALPLVSAGTSVILALLQRSPALRPRPRASTPPPRPLSEASPEPGPPNSPTAASGSTSSPPAP
ncbi:SDR family oxidoreductase [Streptomyces anulatus]